MDDDGRGRPCISRDLPFLIVESSTSSPNKKEKVQSPNPSLVATTIACKHVGCKIPSTEFYVYIRPLAASFTGIRAHSRWI